MVHVTESDFTRDARGVARFEGGGRSGPITLAHAREILGHAYVTIRPVIDLAHQLPADGYEFTGTLREAAFLATPVDCFPYAVSTSRTMQLDHTIPYDDTRATRPDPPRQRRPPDPTTPPDRHPRTMAQETTPPGLPRLVHPPRPLPDHQPHRHPHPPTNPRQQHSSTAPPPNNDSSPTCSPR